MIAIFIVLVALVLLTAPSPFGTALLAVQAALFAVGVGLGVAGLVDADRSRVYFAPNLRWSQVPVRALLEVVESGSKSIEVGIMRHKQPMEMASYSQSWASARTVSTSFAGVNSRPDGALRGSVCPVARILTLRARG